MDAMARPGETRRISTAIVAPPPLTPTAAAIAKALFDYETPVWLDPALAAVPDVAQWLKFETGAPLARDPRDAAFALIADAAHLPPFETFSLGTDEYPDRSTTLIVQVERFDGGDPITLSGPGIARPRAFAASPLPQDLARRLAANRALFPRGVDLVLAGPEEIAALPRSIHAKPGRP
jgi:alpha-D-ribose 1-methylphosphonate 5-triphosphate synthase subunit PhnH